MDSELGFKPDPETIRPIGFSRRAEIYKEGGPAGQIYRVISGAVRTSKLRVNGKRQIGAFYLPGEIFGVEIESQHLFSAEAIVRSQVLLVQRGDVDAALEECEIMRGELKNTRNRMLLLGKTAQERVASFLLDMSERTGSLDEVELPMSRQDIADYLGLTMETVSRTLTQLESEAVIAMPETKRIVLHERADLEMLADIGAWN